MESVTLPPPSPPRPILGTRAQGPIPPDFTVVNLRLLQPVDVSLEHRVLAQIKQKRDAAAAAVAAAQRAKEEEREAAARQKQAEEERKRRSEEEEQRRRRADEEQRRQEEEERKRRAREEQQKRELAAARQREQEEQARRELEQRRAEEAELERRRQAQLAEEERARKARAAEEAQQRQARADEEERQRQTRLAEEARLRAEQQDVRVAEIVQQRRTPGANAFEQLQHRNNGAAAPARPLQESDYVHFEHGLAPPDPWTPPTTIRDEVQELYGLGAPVAVHQLQAAPQQPPKAAPVPAPRPGPKPPATTFRPLAPLPPLAVQSEQPPAPVPVPMPRHPVRDLEPPALAALQYPAGLAAGAAPAAISTFRPVIENHASSSRPAPTAPMPAPAVASSMPGPPAVANRVPAVAPANPIVVASATAAFDAMALTEQPARARYGGVALPGMAPAGFAGPAAAAAAVPPGPVVGPAAGPAGAPGSGPYASLGSVPYLSRTTAPPPGAPSFVPSSELGRPVNAAPPARPVAPKPPPPASFPGPDIAENFALSEEGSLRGWKRYREDQERVVNFAQRFDDFTALNFPPDLIDLAAANTDLDSLDSANRFLAAISQIRALALPTTDDQIQQALAAHAYDVDAAVEDLLRA